MLYSYLRGAKARADLVPSGGARRGPQGICICICMCIYIYIYICISIAFSLSLYLSISLYIYIYMTCVYIYIYIYTYDVYMYDRRCPFCSCRSGPFALLSLLFRLYWLHCYIVIVISILLLSSSFYYHIFLNYSVYYDINIHYYRKGVSFVLLSQGCAGSCRSGPFGRRQRWTTGYMYVCVYIYIYIALCLSLSLSPYIYIYIYVYIYIYIYIWRI